MRDLTLISNSHQRYENNRPTNERQFCGRAILIQNKNFSDIFNGAPVHPSTGFLVRLINTDLSNQDIMMPILMTIVEDTGTSILLKGVSIQINGIYVPTGDFTNYGLKLLLKNRQVDSCTLYIYDKNVKIVYDLTK